MVKITEDGRGKSPGSIEALASVRDANRESAEAKKGPFLEALKEYWPNISEAAQRAGWSRTQAYLQRQRDEAFRQAWEEIVDAKLDVIENRVINAGFEKGGAGYLFPILKAYRRGTYGDKLEHSGSIGTANITLPQGIPDIREAPSGGGGEG